MPQCWWGVFVALAFALTSQAAAQVRQVAGRVTNAQTGEGVPEATVAVTGTRIVAQTGQDGRFSLNAPAGPLALVVRGIGFRRLEVNVPFDQETVSVALEPDIFKLEEVVVTGQSTGIERQNLPNAVATVSGSELTRAPTGTIESALQGKIPAAYRSTCAASRPSTRAPTRSGSSTASSSATRPSPTAPMRSLRPRRAAIRATRTTRPTASVISIRRTSSGSRCSRAGPRPRSTARRPPTASSS
jgi:hypothetical protein